MANAWPTDLAAPGPGYMQVDVQQTACSAVICLVTISKGPNSTASE